MIKSLVVYLSFLAIIPMSMLRAHVGVLGYYWFSFMVPQRTADIVEIGWAKVIVLAALISWIGNSAFRSLPSSGILYAYLAFAIWTVITTLSARFPGLAGPALGDFLKVVLMYVLATSVFTTRNRIHAAIWIIVLTVGFWGVFGALKVAAGGGGFVISGPKNSGYGDNNGFALWVLMAIPWLGYLMLQSDKRWVRMAVGAAIPLMLLTIVGTDSRGAFVGIAAIGFVYFFFSRRKIFVVTVGAVLAGLVLLILSQERLDRYTNRVETIQTYEEDGSVQGRLHAWGFAIDRANLRFPLADGFEAFRGNLTPRGSHRVAHSLYFEVLGEHGWIGLFLYLLWIVLVGMKSWLIYRRCLKDPEMYWARDLGFMAILSLTAYLSAGAFLSVAYIELMILISALVICTDVQVRARLAERRRQAPAPAREVRHHAAAAGRSPIN